MRIQASVGRVLLLVAVCVALVNCQTQDDDEVDIHVPNYNHKFFSGYLPLSVMTNPKRIHYVFFHSQNDLSADPLIVWFTGGPGCSSLLALFHENGPFIFATGKTYFELNDDAWNKKANVLYLQMPAGVGFSDGPEDETITDESFTKDAMNTLRQFFARFPTFKKNQLYLAGHGYAGVYITYLAKQIIDENNDPFVIYNDNFNLKGIIAGNPCTRPDECYASGIGKHSYYHYEFLYNRAYFSNKVWNQFRGACLLNYSSFGCFQQRTVVDKIFNDTNSSMYNIYSPCYKSKTTDNYINTGCEDNLGILTYLNDARVRDFWNIRTDKEWTPCNDKIHAEYQNGQNSYHLYPELIKNRLRIWIYSGDLDSYIPIIGTKRWIDDLRHELEMPVRRIWREWWVPGRHKGEDQVGGFIWQLRDLTFVTVKGAGFNTALDQPKAMAEVLAGFLAGKTLPYKNQ